MAKDTNLGNVNTCQSEEERHLTLLYKLQVFHQRSNQSEIFSEAIAFWLLHQFNEWMFGKKHNILIKKKSSINFLRCEDVRCEFYNFVKLKSVR